MTSYEINSTTPKYTIDWYIKWVASAFVLSAMTIRGIEELVIYDLSYQLLALSYG